MKRILKALALVTLLVLGPAMSHEAEALPVLQLDFAGGTYDPVTETVVADSGPFTLYAILTPERRATQQEIDALLGTTFYISVALTPQLGDTDPSLGSFSFAGDNVNVTSDMTYGVPPIETPFQGDFDLALLTSGYQVQFDHYDTIVRTCLQAGNCTTGDVDRDHRFRPFSHNAGTRNSIPEPASALFMLVGLVGAGGFAGRRGFARNSSV